MVYPSFPSVRVFAYVGAARCGGSDAADCVRNVAALQGATMSIVLSHANAEDLGYVSGHLYSLSTVLRCNVVVGSRTMPPQHVHSLRHMGG